LVRRESNAYGRLCYQYGGAVRAAWGLFKCHLVAIDCRYAGRTPPYGGCAASSAYLSIRRVSRVRILFWAAMPPPGGVRPANRDKINRRVVVSRGLISRRVVLVGRGVVRAACIELACADLGSSGSRVRSLSTTTFSILNFPFPYMERGGGKRGVVRVACYC
jgi:hypothetical protein